MRLLKPMAFLVLVLIAAVASMQAFAPLADAAFADADGDGFSGQVEHLFGSNALNAGSVPESAGFPILFRTDLCNDALDNDLDGHADGTDTGCADNDEDLFSDEVEQQFGAPFDDADYYPEASTLDNALISLDIPIQFCADGRDNDDDDLVDAADPGCTDIDTDDDGFADLTEKTVGSDVTSPTSVPEHETFNPGSCSDGDDNDSDGTADAADDGCLPLPNDDFADARSIASLPFTHTTKVLSATIEPSERMSDCVLEEEGNTVWYRYTPGQSQTVVLDTSGTDFTTITAVWQQGTFGLSQVTCANGFGFYTFDPQSRLSFQAEAGHTYYIQIGAESTFYKASGRLILSATVVAPPANDDFANATAFTQLPYSISTDSIAATDEFNEPESSCVSTSDERSVRNTLWYAYTPTSDGFVQAKVDETAVSGEAVAVFQGSSPATLQQVACSYPSYPFSFISRDSRLAFHARAGQRYYIQAGSVAFSGFNQSGTAQGAGGAGFSFGSPGGRFRLTVENLTPPSCPVAEFTIQDPTGELPGVGQYWDIDRVSGAFTADHLCLDLHFAGPFDPAVAPTRLQFDTDLSRETGSDQLSYRCGRPTGVEADALVGYEEPAGLLVRMVPLTDDGGTPTTEIVYGFAQFSGDGLHFALPLDGLGDDTSLRLAVSVEDTVHDIYDCAPDGGHIACANGTCAFVPFRNGDANCVSGANAIDAALVLQHSAGLLASLPCPDAADVDGNGVVDSRDAALVLQFAAGLLDQLPPEECIAPRPEFC